MPNAPMHMADSKLRHVPTRQEMYECAEQAGHLARLSLQNDGCCKHNAPLIVRLNIELLEMHKQSGRMSPEAWSRACRTQILLYRSLEDRIRAETLRLADLIR